MNKNTSYLPSLQNRILVRLLCFVLVFMEFASVSASAQAAASSSVSSTAYIPNVKDPSVVGRDAQAFSKTLGTPQVSVTGTNINLGVKEKDGTVKSVVAPFSYTSLTGKGPTTETTDDQQKIYNDASGLDNEGGKRQNQLYQEGSTSNPATTEGSAYQVVMKTRTATKPNMQHDAMFNTTRNVREHIDDISKNFADCKDSLTFVDTEKSGKINETKSCTKIYDKSEKCTIRHNYTVGLISAMSGDVQSENPSNSQMIIKIGKIGDDYLKSGKKCTLHSSQGLWRIDNPDAITKVTLTRSYVDDYMNVKINGSSVYKGPVGHTPPAGPSAQNCELGTTWDEHPGTDLTSIFKNTPAGNTLTFGYDVLVGGEGEAEAEITIDYDRTKIVKKEYYTPDSCIDHWNSAKNGYATLKYQCTDSLDPNNLQSGEYKGSENNGSANTSSGNTLCNGSDYQNTCPTDSANPWTLGTDGTCYRNETLTAPPSTQDTNGCADPNYTYNIVNGLCEYKDNLVALDYSPVATFTCPNGWALDVPTNTCLADVLKTKLAVQNESKGCLDSSYTYDPDTDSCFQPGYDPKTYQSTDVYQCPLDLANPWVLEGKQCHRVLNNSTAPYDNSYYSCADKTFKYDSLSNACLKTTYTNQPYAITPTYTCPVDATDPWTLAGNKCQRYVKDLQPPYSNSTCPTLYILDSSGASPMCLRMVLQSSFAIPSPAELCPSGWQDSHTDCQQSQVTTAASVITESLSCPTGYALDQTGAQPVCTGKKSEWVDATKVTSFYCGSGLVMDGNTKTCISSTGSTGTTPLVNYECPVDTANPWTLVSGHCERTKTTNAQPVITPAVTCPVGFYWDATYNSCTKTDISSVPYSSTSSKICPNDPSNPWSYDSNSGQCTRHKVLTEPANHIIVKSCTDASYHFNNITDRCEKTVTETATVIPATYTCPVDTANPWTLSGSTCTRTISSTVTAAAMPVLSCSVGFTLSGNTCVQTIVVNQPASQNSYCPNGFILSGTNCIKYASTTNYTSVMSCPIGYTLTAGTANTCYLNQTVPATTAYSCPSGFTLTGTTCSKTTSSTLSAKQQFNCPSNYLWDGTTCLKKTTNTAAATSNYSCPTGYTASGVGAATTCSKTDTVQPTTKCAVGYTANGTNCEKVTKADAQKRTLVCDSSLVKNGANYFSIGVSSDAKCNYANSDTCNPEDTTCIQNVTSEPNQTKGFFGTSSGYSVNGFSVYDSSFVYLPGTCPTGFTYAGAAANDTFWQSNTCTKVEPGTPAYSCGTGWTLNGAVCNKPVTATPNTTYSCATGYVLSGVVCYETTSDTAAYTSTYSCDSGWTLNGTDCTYSANTTFNASVSNTCASGVLNGTNCIIADTQPAGVGNSCPTGYTNGSSCEKTTVTAAVVTNYTCPTGYTLSGSTCSKSTVNTTSTSIVYTCPNGWIISGNSCALTVIDTQSSSLYYTCPNGWTLSGNNCSMAGVASQPADTGLACPNGWTLSGSTCSIVNPVSASVYYTCDSGWSTDPSDSAKCRQPYNVYANPYMVSRQCQTVYPQLGSYGTLMGAEVYLQAGFQCKYWVIPPGPQPYAEYHPIVSTTSSKYGCSGTNISCFVSTYEVYSAEPCDAGWTYTGGIYSAPNTCQKVQYNTKAGNVNYSCSNGTLSGSSCLVTTNQGASTVYSCPSGFTLSGTTCNKPTINNQVATSNYSCPTGYSLVGTDCQKTTVSNQPATTNITCPTGWTLNGTQTQCNMTTVDNQPATPVYSCPTGTLTGTNCVTVVNQNATVAQTCPNGWTDNGSGCVNGTNITQPASVSYSCGVGYVYVGGSTCAKTTITSVPATSSSNSYSCDPGFTLDASVLPNICRKVDTQVIAAVQQTPSICPSNYTLDGNQCTRYTDYTMAYVVASDSWQCSAGYTLDSATHTCTFDNGAESTPVSSTSTTYCPTGYTDSGYNCQIYVYYFSTEIPAPAVYACPTGFTIDLTSTPICVKSELEQQAPVVINLATCPLGWVNTGNQCYAGVSPVVPSIVLSIGFSCDIGWSLDTAATPPQCTLLEHKVREPIAVKANTCPTGWTDTGVRCEQFDLVTKPPVLIKNALLCPAGYTLNGTTCEKTTKKNTPANRVCVAQSSAASSEDLSIFNALTKNPLGKTTQKASASSTPAVQKQAYVAASSKQNKLTKESLAHYISKVTTTPPLGGDGVDNCITDSVTGVYVCESDFGSSPLPPDALISPFCKSIDVEIDYDYYKGNFSYVAANGETVNVQAGLNNDDNCADLEKDSSCSFRTTRCVEGFSDADGRCYLEEHVYDCGPTVTYNDVEAKKDVSCNGTVRCMGSDCLDPASEKSPSFQKAAALMNAAEMMTTDMSCDIVNNGVSDCKVFAGKKYSCKVAVGGAQDCCDVPTGITAKDYLTAVMAMYKANKALMSVENASGVVGSYQSMASGVADAFSSVTQPFASSIENVSGAVDNFVSPVTDVIDSLKEQIKKYIEDAINSLFKQTGSDMAANAGTTAATEEVTDQAAQDVGSKMVENMAGAASFLMAAYTAYCVAMLIIQTIYKCEQEEFELAPKRDTKNCTYIGQKKVSWLEKQYVYCCFNSPLSRIINEQAAIQLGHPLPEQGVNNPDCSGITVTQMGQLDWEKMDLSEWTALLQQYNLGTQMSADEMTADRLTGSGSVYNKMFPDSQRENVIDRTKSRMDGIDFEEQAKKAKEQAPSKIDGCTSCK